MKDNLQNISDLIGALAEDIEEIKKILAAKDVSDKDEAVKSLAVKLEPVIRFFGSSTPENINGIFMSKETIEAYKKSLGEEMIVSLQAYTDANDKDMRKRGIPTTKDLLYKILEVLTDHVEKDKRILEKAHPKQGFTRKLWLAIRPERAINGIRRLWGKVPDGWYKNPYAWAGIVCTLVFFALFAVSWVRWHEYREENKRLKTVADKYQVTTFMLKELYPELGVTVGAYEKLVETVGKDSTLTVFNRQLEKVRNENESKQ
ncbi:hypothetical protein DW165_17210 [Bacteroides ovatus]|jgi:hypothetical protein|uniref:hypothetical protein n=1 Tax=Bacteroidales TaxID=171549 RepID=UPI000E5012A7|nr:MULTISPECIES: hypothetical protein [Bacteroidales]MCM0726410.1 hypothetical protein [Parabacteroides sp. Y3-G-102]RHI48648.1 hypothetical protein DW165_17210 [Bacteroides ovatus]RHI52996.1 hypothetical protein DW163_17100 [Bacteroides ovatus]RHI63206.1 hypothetical protein DW161_16585 [Bacteroides ovatus]RHK81706.1 hypothetical protein DW047_10820 [Phocaeicola vulgatus]